ncbi:hypothetical protein DFH06DRAFT_1463960 [Mycena polygramma]|nr:hypothetical protein DFH06DRAFT_1463960 [Mycena polygramma]
MLSWTRATTWNRTLCWPKTPPPTPRATAHSTSPAPPVPQHAVSTPACYARAVHHRQPRDKLNKLDLPNADALLLRARWKRPREATDSRRDCEENTSVAAAGGVRGLPGIVLRTGYGLRGACASSERCTLRLLGFNKQRAPHSTTCAALTRRRHPNHLTAKSDSRAPQNKPQATHDYRGAHIGPSLLPCAPTPAHSVRRVNARRILECERARRRAPSGQGRYDARDTRCATPFSVYLPLFPSPLPFTLPALRPNASQVPLTPCARDKTSDERATEARRDNVVPVRAVESCVRTRARVRAHLPKRRLDASADSTPAPVRRTIALSRRSAPL